MWYNITNKRYAQGGITKMPERRTIYLDHAATSGKKAPGVADAAAAYLRETAVNVNRSTYALSSDVAMRVLRCRELLADRFRFDSPTHVVFTPGQTAGLNMVIKGLLRPGDRVLVSSMEHNAVMRPLKQLERLIGITSSFQPLADRAGKRRAHEPDRAPGSGSHRGSGGLRPLPEPPESQEGDD